MAAALLAFGAAAARAQSSPHVSAAGGLSNPIGDLGSASQPGFNADIRIEGSAIRVWGWRADITWDQFGGRGVARSYSYAGLTANVLYRVSPQIYEFGGFGVYNQRIPREAPLPDINDVDPGLQFGIGYNFSRSPGTTPFVEIGLANVFAARANETWIPVRIGIRF